MLSKMLFLVTKLCPTLCNSIYCSPPSPLSMGFPRQEYPNGLPFPSSGDLPDPGIESASPAWQVDSLPLSHLGSALTLDSYSKNCIANRVSVCVMASDLLSSFMFLYWAQTVVSLPLRRASLVAQMVKNLPAVQEARL